MSLAMMPIDTVLVSYDEIRNDAQQLADSPMEPLLTYFEKQWLPDINLWNVSSTNFRTNNVCEGKSEMEFISKTMIALYH
jgi:hypothetical protein